MAALLDPATRAFVQSAVSMIAATANAQRRSHLVRCVGCRLEGERMNVFASRLQSSELITDIQANGRIALVFSQPTTNRTVQLKGDDAAVLALAPGDLERVAKYRAGLAEELGTIGFGGAFARALLDAADDDIVVLSFTITQAYSQTPGPKAGEPLNAATAAP